jgi:hypothetical protein
LLRFFDRAARSADQAEPLTAGAQDTGASALTAPETPALTPASLPASAAVTAPLNGARNTSHRLNGTAPVACPSAQGRQALLADAALPWRASPSPQRQPGEQPSAAEVGALPATLR